MLTSAVYYHAVLRVSITLYAVNVMSTECTFTKFGRNTFLWNTLPRVELENAVTFFVFSSKPLWVKLVACFCIAFWCVTFVRLQLIIGVEREVERFM